MENQNTEYKESWRDEYLKWICGFANSQGGKIYIGIDDDEKTVGVEDSKKLLEDLPNKIRDSLGIITEVNLIKKDNLDVIEIIVPSYNVPISCRGSYYIRSGATNQKLIGLELEHFIMRKRGATWDNSPLPIFTEKDVDLNAVELFKKRAIKKSRIDESVLNETVTSLLKKLHLENNNYLTNAAMLLFSDDPEKWQLGAYIKIGFFESDADLMYQDEIHAPLLEQADKVIELLHLKYMKALISYQGLQRVEKYFVPDDALREAILNAICHKDYSSGIPIQISVYKDKIYIANCGHLPENLSVEKLMSKHSSEPYNPQIAHVFYLAGLIESWGRGIEKICAACERENIPLPVYTINNRDLMVKFSSNSSSKKEIDDCPEIAQRLPRDCPEVAQKTFEYICKNPNATIKQIHESLGISERTVKNHIAILKGQFIERVGSDAKGYWKIVTK